jgi:hypothetical protein
MSLLIHVLIAAVVAIVAYVVLTTLLSFPSSGLIFGLLCVLIFLVIAFGSGRIGAGL